MLPVLTGEASSPGSEPADDCCVACAAASTAAHVVVVPLAAMAIVPPGSPVPQLPIVPTTPQGSSAPPPVRGPLPVLQPGMTSGVGIARSGDRRIAFGGLVIAGVFLALAVAALALPPELRLGAWLPVHLALAGAAATAIAGLLPFFTAALVVAPPARPAVRIGGVALVAVGAAAAMLVTTHARGEVLPATLAGGSFLAGLGLVAAAAFIPLRGALGPRRPLAERAYAAALANVAVGVTIATLLVGGNLAVGGAWYALKPAHAWLNLIGFASLVVIATLLHLAPTIAGSRIRPRISGRLAVIGVAAGAPLVAAGYATDADLIARAGAVAVLIGAFGVATHGAVVALDRERGRWTTDAGWHQFTGGAFLMGQAWLGVGLAIAAGRVLAAGADPAAWSLSFIAGPLLIGGVAQVLLGAMTHLLPAIGPGDPVRHAVQRRTLGRGAMIRLMALNAGVTLVALGAWSSVGPGSDSSVGTAAGALVPIGLTLAALAAAGSLALLGSAARRGRVRQYFPGPSNA